MKRLILAVMFIVLIVSCPAQPKKYPVPSQQEGFLFYLQHSRNSNTVIYQLNLKNGKLVAEDPVHVFWIRYAEKGQNEELSYIQRKFAYGINVVKLQDKSYQLSLAAKRDYKMYLQQSSDGNFHVYTTVNKKRFILTHLFINISGGSILSPKVEYVDVFGFDEVSKLPIFERVKIG